VSPTGAFNTAVSFVTNTNWQWYSGEVAMSHLSQMIGLAVQNFVSAAVGLRVASRSSVASPARHRALARQLLGRPHPRPSCASCCRCRSSSRSCSMSQGVVQNLSGNHRRPRSSTRPHEVVVRLEQAIPGGPVASQEAIKQLGTNGGGFYNANSAHPFENPNGLTNLLEIWAILLIPFALVVAFGRW
jgi:K+-transporting ATPase ATPase A chain